MSCRRAGRRYIASLIKLAAQDNDVTRIFISPAIKQQLCLDAGSDRLAT